MNARGTWLYPCLTPWTLETLIIEGISIDQLETASLATHRGGPISWIGINGKMAELSGGRLLSGSRFRPVGTTDRDGLALS